MGFIKKVPSANCPCIRPWPWPGVGSIWQCDSCERIYERVEGERPWMLQEPEAGEPEGGHWEYGWRDDEGDGSVDWSFNGRFETRLTAKDARAVGTLVRRWRPDPGPWEVVE